MRRLVALFSPWYVPQYHEVSYAHIDVLIAFRDAAIAINATTPIDLNSTQN